MIDDDDDDNEDEDSGLDCQLLQKALYSTRAPVRPLLQRVCQCVSRLGKNELRKLSSKRADLGMIIQIRHAYEATVHAL